MAADAATLAGLPLANLTAETRTALDAVLPTFATTTNPVDVTAALLTNSRLFNDILPIIARDPTADAFLVAVPVAGTGYDVEAFACDTASFAEATGKPIVVATPQPSVAAHFKSAGLATFQIEAHALSALGRFIAHRELVAAKRTHRFAALPRRFLPLDER